MPAPRSPSAARSTRSKGWMRPISFCTSGEASCTPRLARLTPIARSERGERMVEPARIELDGVFLQRREIEQRGEPRGDGLQPVRAEDRGRAAAPVQMLELAALEPVEQLDLVDQPLGIGVDRLALAHRAGVAAAIEAELGAERHVDIERERRLGRQRGEPLGIAVGPILAEKCGAVG